MKLTKTLALAALAATTLLGGSLTLQAEDTNTVAPAPPAARAHRLTPDQIVKELGLSDDVAAKFKTAWEDRTTQIRALRDDSSLSGEEKRTKSKAIMEAFQAKMKEILTPEQQEKLKKLIPGGPRRAPLAKPATAPAANASPN